MEVLRLLLFLVFGNLSLLAYFLALRLLFPRRVEKTRAVSDAMPGRAFLVGLVNFLFIGGIALGFIALSEWAGSDVPGIPALFFLGVLGLGVSFGLAGVVQLVGERLLPQAAALPRTLAGALALVLACELPFFGWFLLLPYAGLVGLGAFIIGFFLREQPETE